MRFAEIKPFTQTASYSITTDWKHLEATLKDYDDHTIPGFVFDLNPDFQRAHVWTEEQQRRFVEFVLRGGRSSRDIYWNCVGWQRDYRGPMVLVDGKQRLEAVRKFLRNELAIFDGHTLADFTDSISIVRPSFNFHVNNLPTRAAVLQWYIDLNTGGVVHTTEDIAKVRHLLKAETVP